MEVEDGDRREEEKVKIRGRGSERHMYRVSDREGEREGERERERERASERESARERGRETNRPTNQIGSCSPCRAFFGLEFQPETTNHLCV